MKEPQSLFGQRLRNARIKAGVSQKQLGLEIGLDNGVASARMNQYEVGSHSPKYSTAVKIASALNIPTSYFYEDDEQVSQLIMFFSKLDSKDRKNTFTYVEKLLTKTEKNKKTD